MSKLSDKIRSKQEDVLQQLEKSPSTSEEGRKLFFSFEYFPPKTEVGLTNLYEVLKKMVNTNPLWIDVTWGRMNFFMFLSIFFALTFYFITDTTINKMVSEFHLVVIFYILLSTYWYLPSFVFNPFKGAGGSTADATFSICEDIVKKFDADVMMHLTCTNMEVAIIDEVTHDAWIHVFIHSSAQIVDTSHTSSYHINWI